MVRGKSKQIPRLPGILSQYADFSSELLALGLLHPLLENPAKGKSPGYDVIQCINPISQFVCELC